MGRFDSSARTYSTPRPLGMRLNPTTVQRAYRWEFFSGFLRLLTEWSSTASTKALATSNSLSIVFSGRRGPSDFEADPVFHKTVRAVPLTTIHHKLSNWIHYARATVCFLNTWISGNHGPRVRSKWTGDCNRGRDGDLRRNPTRLTGIKPALKTEKVTLVVVDPIPSAGPSQVRVRSTNDDLSAPTLSDRL